MIQKEFFLPCGGINLHCKLDLPTEDSLTNASNSSSKHPLVLVIPGLTGHMEEPHIVAITNALPRSGYAVLRVELYGHGLSGGSFHDHNLFLWSLEIMELIDYARKLDFVTELYLCGHSQGGTAAVLGAGLKADLLDGLILLAPAMLMKENAMTGGFPVKFYDPEHIPDETLVFDEQPISGNYYRVNRLLPFDEAIHLYGNRPVLLIQSRTDELIPFSCVESTASAYKNAELFVIEEDDHCFDSHIDLVTREMIRFLDEIQSDK